MKFPLAEQMGLKGEWMCLRGVWNEATKGYLYECSTDNVLWFPYENNCNVISIRYIGGPKDGKVEW